MDDVAADNAEDLSRQAMDRDLHRNVEERGLGNADLAAWQAHLLIEKRLLGVIVDHLGLFE